MKKKTLSKHLPEEHLSRPPDLFSGCVDDMIAVVDEDFTLSREELKDTLKLLLLVRLRMSLHGPKTSEDEDAE